MRTIRYLANLTKAVVASRTAQTFFFIHLALLAIALLQKATIHQTIQPIHFENEFWLYAILSVFNMPASIIAGIICFPILLLFISFNLENNLIISNSFVVFMYVGWQIQSALIGYGIEKLLNRWRSMK